jgi:hypothetical protein
MPRYFDGFAHLPDRAFGALPFYASQLAAILSELRVKAEILLSRRHSRDSLPTKYR